MVHSRAWNVSERSAKNIKKQGSRLVTRSTSLRVGLNISTTPQLSHQGCHEEGSYRKKLSGALGDEMHGTSVNLFSAHFGKLRQICHKRTPGITRNHQDTFASTFFHARVQSNWTPLAAFIGSGSPFQCGAVPRISMAFSLVQKVRKLSMLAVDDPSYDDFNMYFLRLHLNHLPILPRDLHTQPNCQTGQSLSLVLDSIPSCIPSDPFGTGRADSVVRQIETGG